MKAFAIITAGLMAVGGGVYFLSESSCPTSRCGGASVARTGGCCDLTAGACTVDDQLSTCSVAAEAVAAAVKPSSCCGPKEECCAAQTACCAATKVAAKPIEITGCCDEGATPARAVIGAAKGVAAAVAE